MKVCICGGGNLAHAFVGEISNNKLVSELNVLTRQPDKWSNDFNVFYNHEFHHQSHINKISNDYEILSNADIIIITIPAYARFSYLQKIKKYIKPKSLLLVAPSTGGINFIFDKYFPNNNYACFQRVPYICRTIEYGHSVNTEVKNGVDIYFSKNTDTDTRDLVKNLLQMEIRELNTYWTLFLSNSNPILHIAGVCEILNGTYPLSKPTPLYDAWSDYASELTLNMDNELKKIMSTLNVNEYKALLEHYEVSDVQSLTKKLKSIQSFKQVQAPLTESKNGYIIDNTSRYITEDLPFGTCFIKFMATQLNIDTPYIDFAIRKTQSLYGQEFVDNNGQFNKQHWETAMGFSNELIEYIERITKV
ncbi:MAG: NAD/NADP octopine/nopaline dehydrogenase family protein [Candidatus Gastranaerophilales bacterium]|nr:NAD/NADP octopine/nopaline dehydrogenase family protein [Candidatus Gastranaerophilales bacterium]